jgi:hypothetical protein
LARLRGDLLAVTACLLISVANSLPRLVHAEELHSDAAVVGLQAMHFLKGEHSWFLWGSGYQTSFDSWVAAAFFKVFGPTPTALMASAFVGYLVLTLFAYATLRRRFEPWSAALLVTPLLFIAGPVRFYAFSPPRQGSLTLLFAAVFVIDGAPRARWAVTRMALGAALSGLACLADPYCLVCLPAVLLFIVLTAREADGRGAAWLALTGVLALGVGLVPFWLVSHSAGATHAVYGFRAGLLSHNAKLLAHLCLPYTLGIEVPLPSLSWAESFWRPPAWFHGVQLVGAASFLGGIVLGGLLSLRRATEPHDRSLAAFGALMLPVAVGAFLLSVMVMDRSSSRYLAAIVLAAPFALAPVLRAVGRRTFALGLAPYVVSVMVGGCIADGTTLHAVRSGFSSGIGRDERALAEFLRSRGIEAGMADYWVAYRLTFLFREQPVIVPYHPELDRHAFYRTLVDAAEKVAYVYDPKWSKEDLHVREAQFEGTTRDFEPGFESARLGRYTVLLLTRKSSSALRMAGTRIGARPSAPDPLTAVRPPADPHGAHDL